MSDKLLHDLADAARSSGLVVIELDGWQDNYSPGGFDPDGVLNHHTGSYDGIADPADDLAYAKWLAFTGRPDLDPPLCNLALSAECVVYVCSSGNANHAGAARASGPMPAASDGNRLYIGIEAMNSGSQGWGSQGRTADGEQITQGEAYARLNAALNKWYGWPASHDRAHRETSLTGKIDPAGLDMDAFRARIAVLMEDDPMADYAAQLDRIEQKLAALAADEDARSKALRKAVRQQAEATRARLRKGDATTEELAADVDKLLELVAD